MEEAKDVKEKKQFKILGFSIWRLMAYFILYSFMGFIIETTYGLLTKGVIESRQSFLYGPFCSIYGVGAVVMIVFLQYFKKNKYTLFFGGFLIGSITEYLISLIGELIFNVIWWDYSNQPYNLQGRICLAASLFWGLLSIIFMNEIHPFIEKRLKKVSSKIPIKIQNGILYILIFATLVDLVLSVVKYLQ